jgi:hypothetical protein
MTQNIQIPSNRQVEGVFEQLERRINTSDRRKDKDRRSQSERRFDSRVSGTKQKKTIRIWLREKTQARLGVDRRKNEDRRIWGDRRQQPLPQSILTREEIDDLLS